MGSHAAGRGEPTCSITPVGHRTDRTFLAAILLPPAAVLGYALVIGAGFLWPERQGFVIGASITVSVLLWMVSTVWFQRRTGWSRTPCIVMLAVSLAFPMVGAASLGTDLALEEHADRVSGEVSVVEVEQTNRDEDEESFRTTYTFVASDDRRELGAVDYRGEKNGHDLEVGDRTDLLVDPSGELPVKLAEKVDSSQDVGMIVLGGVLFSICYVIGLGWPVIRTRIVR